MQRISLKVIGSSGQGLDSIGEVIAKALKRSGYCVFGYREYQSLIKGGHASNQLDVSDEKIESSESTVNIIIALNHHVLEKNLRDLKPGGILLHSTEHWKFSKEDESLINRLSLQIVELPIEKTLQTLKAKPILGNVLITAFVWAILGQKKDDLKTMVGERFAKKKDLLALNMACIDEGFALREEHKNLTVSMPKPKKQWKECLLLTGSKAMGLGTIAAGVRVFAGYPMTPSSFLLSYVASVQNQTGMVIKQAEDEITAAQFVSGAMHAGTRAITTTSGGGFDLMSETVSMNAIIENPTVFVLAQRPGPATGLPTWTSQGDLLMAIGTSHGEFARCVLSVSDAEDSFSLIGEAFNIAEKYQISVIVLTDKQIAEGLYTAKPFDSAHVNIDRGSLVTDEKKLSKLKAGDRYSPTTKDGISPRWLPGTNAATYAAQGDEHSDDGTVNETSANAVAQMEKRMKKADALKNSLPEPELYGELGGTWSVVGSSDDSEQEIDVLLLGWGSTKSVILDALKDSSLKTQSKKIAYLHYTYLWPLCTQRLESLAKTAKKIVLIEGNYQGQLGMLIRQECGLHITNRILKYDGRPFFVDELAHKISSLIAHSS